MTTPPMSGDRGRVIERITDYLSSGGLFNPELANHEAVRDLLIDARAALATPTSNIKDNPDD